MFLRKTSLIYLLLISVFLSSAGYANITEAKNKHHSKHSKFKLLARKHNHHLPHIPLPDKQASIVVAYPSLTVEYAQNAHEKRYPASLTKVMTLYLLFKALDEGTIHLNQLLPVSKAATLQAPSRLGLKEKETISVRDAIYAIVTKSANDVAVVLAENMAGSEQVFAQMMTSEAHALGMHDTQFKNASGLPIAGQFTTASDLVKLGVAVLRDFPHYYHFFKIQEFNFKGRTYYGHNRLINKFPGCDGLKTGFINASGFNVLTSAMRNGTRYVAVVMGGSTASQRDQRMIQLLTEVFAKPHSP